MIKRPSHYDRAKNLFESNFEEALPTSEKQFCEEYPEEKYTPAEAVMQLQEKHDLVFK